MHLSATSAGSTTANVGMNVNVNIVLHDVPVPISGYNFNVEYNATSLTRTTGTTAACIAPFGGVPPSASGPPPYRGACASLAPTTETTTICSPGPCTLATLVLICNQDGTFLLDLTDSAAYADPDRHAVLVPPFDINVTCVGPSTPTPLPATATFTPEPPTATFTPDPGPATATPTVTATPTATFTPVPPTTATFTPAPATATPTVTSTPTSTATPGGDRCANADVDHDGDIDVRDLVAVAQHLGKMGRGDLRYDVNRDGKVDPADLLIVNECRKLARTGD
jgi:hypothetical protein